MGKIVSWRFKDTPEDQAASKAILEAFRANGRQPTDLNRRDAEPDEVKRGPWRGLSDEEMLRRWLDGAGLPG